MGSSANPGESVIPQQLAGDSVELLRLALVVGDLGLWQWDHTTDEVVLDERGLAIVGAPPGAGSLPVAGLRARAHPDDVRDVVGPEIEAYTGGHKPVYELEFRSADERGEWVWLLLKGFPTERDGLLPRRTAGTITDITARKRSEEGRLKAQKVIAETAQRLDLVLRASRQGIWDWDVPAGTYTTNEMFFTMLGYPPATGPFPAPAFDEMMHPEDRPRVRGLVERAHRDPEAEYRVDLRLRCAGGEYHWIQSWGQVVARDEMGRPLRMMGVHIDIDDHRKESSERRRLQRILQIAVDAMPQSVWWKDREGRFLGANQAVAIDAGLKGPEGLVGSRDADMPWRDQAGKIEADDRAVVESGEARLNLVEPITTAEGQVCWVRANKIPLRDEDGQVIGTLGTFEDITQERQAQEELRTARDAAEAANRAKSEFLARMSHEIRTPMNGILGMTQLALDTELSAFQRDCLETAGSSGEALLTIINDILDFSKVDAGRLVLSSSAFSPRQLVQRLTMLLDVRAREKGLDLRSTISADVPLVLVGDEIRLGQVLTNLVGNAIKFTAAGGAVTLAMSAEACAGDGIEITAEVHDTGLGIAAANLERIFEPFRQADDSTTRHFGGTGLGLAICRQLVGLMEGRIWVESILGEGSCFAFTCRLKLGTQLPEAVSETRTESQVGGRTLRVLLVEDHPVNLKLARHLLERENCQVVTALNGMEAVRAVCAAILEPYDLTLMDCQMPVMNGWDATRTIQEYEQRHGLARAPVVALTANAMDGDRDRCLAAGMDDYLSKPIDRRQLAQVIARYRALGEPEERETGRFQ